MSSTAMPIPRHPNAQGKAERPPSQATRHEIFHITTSKNLNAIKSIIQDQIYTTHLKACPCCLTSLRLPQPQLCLLESDDTGRSMQKTFRQEGRGRTTAAYTTPQCQQDSCTLFILGWRGCHKFLQSLVSTDYTTLGARPHIQCLSSMLRTDSYMERPQGKREFSTFLPFSGASLVQTRWDFKEGINWGWWAPVGRQCCYSCPRFRIPHTGLRFFASMQLLVSLICVSGRDVYSELDPDNSSFAGHRKGHFTTFVLQKPGPCQTSPC